MAKTSITINGFMKQFPDDDACLAHLFRVRYGDEPVCPKCGQIDTFHRLSKLPAYTCNCGHHVHPMQGTPFAKSHTPLQKWFYAMYLFTTSRHGVPAKELQRQLGVTYKTAWRMGHEIRKYMGWVDGDDDLSGHVEIDETMVGGRRSGGKRGRGAPGKTVVLGMVQRGSDVVTRIVPNVRTNTLLPHILENVEPGTIISTDELESYSKLAGYGYQHYSVNHRHEEYVRGSVHTNTIEGFWARLKLSIRGTHVHVSAKHLTKYLAEFEFRFNLRKSPHLMFDALLAAFPKP